MLKLSKKKIKQKNSYKSYGNDIPLEYLNIKKQKTITQKRIIFLNTSTKIIFYILILILLFKVPFVNFSKSNKTTTVNTTRPNIIDKNSEILTTSLPTLTLYAEPHNMINTELSLQKLKKILPYINYKEIKNKLNSNKKFIYIARNITPKEKNLIWQIAEPGFKFIKTSSRVYPETNLFSHIIGLTDIDNKGISGIEKYIDNHMIKNDLSLSIDTYIQYTLYKHLLSGMETYHAKTAAGIILDTKTGEILGMVSLPTFKPSEYTKTISDKIYNNHSSFDIYEIGSILKIFTTAMAFENSYDEKLTFDTSKPIKIGNHTVKDSHFIEKYLDIEKGFIHSSNIVMANIVNIFGSKIQKQFYNKIRMLDKLDFELPETGSTLKPNNWNDITALSIGYGYSISPTLLKPVSSINGIINDGIYINPTIIKRNKNDKIKSYQIVTQSTSQKIKDLMRKVITTGTGQFANIKDIEIAGKTGTSYKIINNKYSKDKTTTFFTSFFPYNSPKYTMIIMLDEANNNNCISASCTTVLVATEIIKDLISYSNLN